MWLQLGLAGLQALQNEQNRKNTLASNVITEKYSGYTGQHGNFGAQGAQSGWKSMIGGLGAGMLQDKLDAKEAAEATANAAKAETKDVSVAATAATPKPTGGFGAAASRAPATVAAPTENVSSFAGPIPMERPAENPWLALTSRPLTPQELQVATPAQPDPTAANRAWAWNNLIPESSPIKRGY